MTYEQWETEVPDHITADTVWKIKAYRLGLFLSDLAWSDVTKLVEDRRTRTVGDQLYRSAGNISSNIAEGYSRQTGKDRARFYEYALGSARETRDWYYKARFVLTDRVVVHRSKLTVQVVRLTLAMVERERRTNRLVKPR